MLNPRDEVGVQDGWAVMGFIESTSACGVLRIPIGVYSLYRDGVAHGNSWIKSTPKAIRYEIEQLYSPITTEEPCDA